MTDHVIADCGVVADLPEDRLPIVVLDPVALEQEVVVVGVCP